MGKKRILLMTSVFILGTLAASAGEEVKKISIDEAVKMALKGNMTVKMVSHDVKTAEAKKKQAEGAYFPKLKLNGGVNLFSDTPDMVKLSNGMVDLNNALDGALDIMSGEYKGLNQYYTLTQNKQLADTYAKLLEKSNYIAEQMSRKEKLDDSHLYYGAKLNFEQPIFTGFKIVNTNEQAKTNIELQKEIEKGANFNTIFEVKKAYYTLLQAEKMYETASEALAGLEEHVNEAKKYFAAGIVGNIDVIRAEVKAADLKQKKLQAENGVNLAKSALAYVIGKEIKDNDFDIVDDINYKFSEIKITDCEETALNNRTEIKQLDKKIQMAKLSEEIAKADFYPTIALLGEVGVKTTKPLELKSDDIDWSVTLGFNYQIFSGFQTINKIEEAKSVSETAVDGKEQAKRLILLDVKQAYLSLNNAKQSIEVSEKVLNQAKETVRLAKASFQSGVGTSLDVIDSQALMTQSKNNFYQAVSQYNIAMAQLEKAMGIAEIK